MLSSSLVWTGLLCGTAADGRGIGEEGSEWNCSKCTLNTGMLGWTGTMGGFVNREMDKAVWYTKKQSKRLKQRRKLDKTQPNLLLSLPSLTQTKRLNEERAREKGVGGSEVESYSSRVSRSLNHQSLENNHRRLSLPADWKQTLVVSTKFNSGGVINNAWYTWGKFPFQRRVFLKSCSVKTTSTVKQSSFRTKGSIMRDREWK